MRAEDKPRQGQGASAATPEGPSGWKDSILEHVGVLWITGGVIMYALLSAVARSTLHSEWAVSKWQAEVPIVVYDRSMFMFATAFVIDVLSACFELKTSRLDMVLLPAYIKGMATVTNTLVRYGYATIGAGAAGNVVMVQRYICWMHTTPTILLLVKTMSTNISKKQAVHAIVCVELMLVTGVAGALASGWMAGIMGVLSHVFFLPLIPYLHQGLTEASAVVSAHAAGPTMGLVRYMTLMMWATFGLIWDLRMFGLVGLDMEEVVYLCCDFSAKVIFSCGLMLSSFKSMDSRREGVMRQIQETHRQTLIQELKRVIEQKDAFMSSVSHELRTPLNGIIGISEGLLSGCCGILNESVRRQIYIVRTSGARLLALINDVMDAAALRQHRLVLKQERLELRQVVGDVSDLTRSLVDNDVTLRNDVPEGMRVWADSGRIIQVLNNLLGNAAKFTHQGVIRVSASWHDEQHQWVAIQVTDTGIGIPKQKLASIFLPFEQVDGSISRQYGGFGLGLSITQELVKAHGGELWVKSKEGKGSCFTFTLPSFTGQTRSAQQQPRVQATASITPGTSVQRGLSGTLSSGALTSLSRHGSRSALADMPAGARSRRSSVLITSAAPAGEVASDARGLQLDRSSSVQAEFADSCVGDVYATELPYDAAQLSALASSKPFAVPSAGSSQRPNLSRRPSSITASSAASVAPSTGAGGEAGARAVRLDPRPTQFARTGRYQILSVDDDTINQTVIQSLLGSTGYEVVTLMSGIKTLEYIDTCEVLPDLILLDVMMPDMSGPEVCAQLAKRDPHLDVPIILVSAHSEEAMVVRGLDSGAVDYITKPFKRAEFLARIRAKLTLSSGSAAQEQVFDEADAAEPLVMCVDDDEVNHIVLEGMLHSANYRYLKARSGAEALKMLEEAGNRPPHLVLLDAALPDTTGLDVLQQLRAQFSQVALPVIMLTARHNEKAIVAALESGANDYAMKPFRRSELLARIRMHIRNSQKAAAAAAATPVSPVAAALAGAEEEMSVQLQQQLPAAEQLKQVPLLVAQLDGLDAAAAGLAPEQLSQLFGTIADLFDAVVEKYAVLKVEASDKLLMVAAPLSSSAANSARNSMQLPTVPPPHNSLAGSSSDTAVQPTAAAGEQQQQQQLLQVQQCSAGVTLQRLLQLAQELMTSLGISHAAADNGCDAVRQHGQVVLPAGTLRDRAISDLVLPACCHGTLQLRVAVHVGELHAGVVGARRPRYRLLGPALQYVKQACAAAPPNSVVATDAAAAKLMALGVQGLEPVSVPWPELGLSLPDSNTFGADRAVDKHNNSGGTRSQLWLVSAAVAAGSAEPPSQLGAGSADQAHLLLRSAALTLGAASCASNDASVQAQQQQLGSPHRQQQMLQPKGAAQMVAFASKLYEQQQQQHSETQQLTALPMQQQQQLLGNGLHCSQVAGWPAAAQQLLAQQQWLAQQQLLLPGAFTAGPSLQPQVSAALCLGNAAHVYGGWAADHVSTPTAHAGTGAAASAGASTLSSGSSSSAPTRSASNVSSCEKAGTGTVGTGTVGTVRSVACVPGTSELAAQQSTSIGFGLLPALQQYTMPGLIGMGGFPQPPTATTPTAHTPVGMTFGLLGSMACRDSATAAAAADWSSALTGLVGWQLGADEAQQMMQLKQEMNDLQQQITAMVGNSLSWSCAAAAASIGAAAQSALSMPVGVGVGAPTQDGKGCCSNGSCNMLHAGGYTVQQVEQQQQQQLAQPLQQLRQQRPSLDDSAGSSGGRSSNALAARCAVIAGVEGRHRSTTSSGGHDSPEDGGSSRTLSPTASSNSGSKLGQLFRRRSRKSKS